MRDKRLKQRFMRFYAQSVEDCRRSIIDNLPADAGGVLLDCGCADGSLTTRFAERVRPTHIIGIEIQTELAQISRGRGFEVRTGDLNEELDIPDATVDFITANQVIEHLYDTDGFLGELHRVMKPGGVAVLATNNLASWHNIVALIVGAQPFPADVSSNSAVGKLVQLFPGDAGGYRSWTHLRIFSFRALREMLEYHGFAVQRIEGVGYYPLPSRLANRVAGLDPRHAAYLTIVCSKR